VNNFQKISVVVIVIILGVLGLAAYTFNQTNARKTGMCISNPEDYDRKCGPSAPKPSQSKCLGGEDFICTKPDTKDVSHDLAGPGW
jgi:hypothetical protein